MTDTAAPEKWEVSAEPVGENPGLKPESKTKLRERITGKKEDADKDNVGGVVVYVQKGSRKEEVARVGFIRGTSEDPKKSFEVKLDEIVEVAGKTADTLNTLTPDGKLV